MRRAEWLVERPWRLVVLVVLVTAPLLVMAELQAADTQRRVEAQQRESLHSLALRGAEATTSRTAILLEKLAGAATTPRLKGAIGFAFRREAAADREIIEPPDVRELSFQLDSFHAVMRDEVVMLFALDGAGFVLETDPPGGTGDGRISVGKDLGGSTYAKTVAPLHGASRYVGVDPDTGSVVVAVPVVQDARLGPRTSISRQDHGALVAELRPAFLERSLQSLSLSVGDLYVVDSQGRALARLNGAVRTLQDLSGHPAVASAVAGGSYLERANDPVTSTAALIATAPIGDLGWHIVAVAREDPLRTEVDAGLAQQRGLRVGLIAVLVLGAALVGGASSAAIRQRRETAEALERQTSISDVLQTIGRSAFDLQPVLDTVVERAVKLCDAREGSISTLEDGVYRTRAYWSASSLPPAYIDFMRQEVRTPDRGSLTGRTALEGRVVHIADVLVDPEYTATDMQQAAGYRTLLGVPLLRDGRVIGVFALTRSEVRPFSDRQIELVRTFADQAAIAIENTRLFVATKEALEQQTAVSEVLKTISRSAFDLQPVLDIVLNNAVRLAGADIGWLSRVENQQFTTVAYSSEFPQSVRDELVRERTQGHIAGPWIPLGTGGGLMGFTLAEGRTVHLPDVKADPELKGSVVARLTESRTVVGVPMLRDGRSIGGMVLARYAVRPFGEREIGLVQTFGDQAAIAIENVRLFNETKEALERQSAVSEVLKTISGTVFDLDPTLQTVVENAAKLADADVAWMMHSIDSKSYTWGPRYGRTPQHEALFGERSPLFARAVEIDRASGSIVGRVYAEARTIEVADAADAAELLHRSPTVRRTKSRSLVGVPVLSEGAVTGAIILGREAVRPFSEREVQLVETFANQAAIAIRNVRLFTEIQDKSHQLEVASRHKSEFLANMSHELRTPLNAIIGFSEVLIQGLFGEVNEKQRDYLQDVIGSGQHLLALINDILDLSKIEAGRMELELSTFSFRSALQSGLTIVRERAARNGITLNVDVSDQLDRVEADERKVKQILYNLLSNAVKFTPDGGNVNVSARRDNGDMRVDVRDNGIGIAEADQARIFEEFQQVGRERSREGTGLGLTLTKRFVELHGGRIWLESAPGQGSTFTFTLPLRQIAPVRA